MTGAQTNAIAERALAQIGTRFRLHGRTPHVALDCVGLVAVAIGDLRGTSEIPSGYRIRGTYDARVRAFFRPTAFVELPPDAACEAGDILLLGVDSRQQHLAVVAPHGWVHAHAGLRRVVLSPPEADRAILQHWRFGG